MTFKQWLKKYVGQSNAIGDLAKDASHDKTFPRTDSYEKVLNYLRGRRACEGAITTFQKAWRIYLKDLDEA